MDNNDIWFLTDSWLNIVYDVVCCSLWVCFYLYLVILRNSKYAKTGCANWKTFLSGASKEIVYIKPTLHGNQFDTDILDAGANDHLQGKMNTKLMK